MSLLTLCCRFAAAGKDVCTEWQNSAAQQPTPCSATKGNRLTKQRHAASAPQGLGPDSASEEHSDGPRTHGRPGAPANRDRDRTQPTSRNIHRQLGSKRRVAIAPTEAVVWRLSSDMHRYEGLHCLSPERTTLYYCGADATAYRTATVLLYRCYHDDTALAALYYCVRSGGPDFCALLPAYRRCHPGSKSFGIPGRHQSVLLLPGLASIAATLWDVYILHCINLHH